ncbi:MAG: hydroxyethylthiazole kinase [Peptoniphilaceae bacterium]|nr:hydroxyethylthiazole kinase [Peptoniphilaceae bacterium]MDD7382818.1 hydroxyethylthiazole kinase [Peptoniphilaceae bacterium]MDY3738223.1 hydroxyethylthiazole kinase [Peptoniphilaceae bacterium]
METYFKNLKKMSPLIHNITNYVTVNDCANIILASGASPIMADDINEVEEITSICNGLNINIGTLNSLTIKSMIKAGKKAKELNHPVVLDPVGAGASSLRTKTALDLIEIIHPDVIKGNISEIKSILGISNSTKGVDADVSDKITSENLDDIVKFSREFSIKTNSTVVITGEIDVVCNDKKTYLIKNGHPMMSTVSGTGCQLSALIASFISANLDNILDSTAAAVCAIGIAGENAYKKLKSGDGNASYRNYIIDSIYNLTPEELEKRARYEIR